MGERHSQAVLVQQALDFIKANKKNDIKGMSKAEIMEWAELKAREAPSEAEALMKSGVWEEETWNRAIRSQILESETDQK